MRLHCLAKLQNSYHCFQWGMARHGIALKVSESFNESHGHALKTCFESRFFFKLHSLATGGVRGLH